MKKICTVLLVLALVCSVWGAALAETEVPDNEKPVRIAIVDELGEPVAGAQLQLLDGARNVLDTWMSDADEHTAFLKEGDYSVEYVSLPDGYLDEAAPVAWSVALTAEETVTDYVGTVEYERSHTGLCHASGHVGLELYTINGDVAYCFNHGLKNPTEDSRYKMLTATPDLLFRFARNKSDDIDAQELYDHVISAIYHTEYVKTAFGLDDAEARYFTYMAIKTYTDPKCFNEFDDEGNSLLMRDEKGRPVKDENGNYVFLPGGTVLGAMMHHVIAENGAPLSQNYIDAYNYLIGHSDHPDNYYLYLYYPIDFNEDDGGSFQCLLSAKESVSQSVAIAVRPSAAFTCTQVWNDDNNQSHLRPSVGAMARKLHLFADGVEVTDLYRSNLTVTDEDGAYAIRVSGLPKLNENKEEIVYTMTIDLIVGYEADQTVIANGVTVTVSAEQLGIFNPPKLDKIKPIPIKPTPIKPVRPGDKNNDQ